MGLRTHLRTAATIVATTVVAALLTAPSATARPCADCNDPDLPGDGGGPNCPTIAATADPYIQTPVSPAAVKVGTTVTARTGTWNSNTKSMKATWYVGGSPATAAGDWGSYVDNRTVSFTVRAEDVGKPVRLWVRGFGSNTQCYKSEYSDDTAVVTPGDAPVAGTPPVVTGSPVFGATLSAGDGAWSPAVTSVSRQWMRDGQPIVGATGATYVVGLLDLGTTLSLTTTGRLAGYADGSVTTTVGTVQLAAAPTWTGGKVGLKGKDRIKKKLKVALGAKKLRLGAAAPDAVLTYQWLRNGKALAAETTRRHRVVKADRKKKLSVRITLTRPGHQPLTVTTKAVKIKNNGRKVS
ncbi:hypothetical protein [Nocardioides daejeonensis]|uniref:hypothetical protein n=1 Tax=Nocardioides daejeonensis TaxID=1046556 RepID=UPI000D74B1C4|nr:hypothetical protein [Nocardioides daejeonensis]